MIATKALNSTAALIITNFGKKLHIKYDCNQLAQKYTLHRAISIKHEVFLIVKHWVDVPLVKFGYYEQTLR
jgi:hypothetical protein